MNCKQLVVLWVGIIAIVLMGLFPPWCYPINVNGLRSRKNAGYHCIFDPPMGKGKTDLAELMGASIDFHRLTVLWIMASAVTGGLVVTLKGKKEAPAI